MDYGKLKKDNPRAIFIAEAGINHDGNLEKAKRMVDVASKADSDYCKFQSFNAKKLVTPTALTSNASTKMKANTARNSNSRKLVAVMSKRSLI